MKILRSLKGVLSQLLSLVFVPKCTACGDTLPSSTALCSRCEKMYLLESKYLCGGCERTHRMCLCRIDFAGSKIPFLHVTGYDVKRTSVSKSLILRIKDNNIRAAFDFLADEMLVVLKERYVRLLERASVVITYVPRSRRARRRAGHDQSEQIAKRIAEKSGAVFMPLFKNNGVKVQKYLHRDEREENARQNYELISPELRLDGLVVVIIDDIVTTGASMGACAAMAKSVGAKAVIALSAAKTEYKKGLTPESDFKI